VNWVGIVIAAIAAMLIGFAWYSPWAFGRTWSSLTGRTMGGGEGTGGLYVLIVASALVEAIAMSWFVEQTGSHSGAAGALVGLFIGLGFIAPAMFGDVLFTGRPGRLFAIVAGYAILTAVVMGAIIGFLGA
jgi:hypothetical protein